MNKIYLALLFLFLGIISLKAQIVNIPDPNFKTALIDEGVDTNGDGEIQVSEAQAECCLNVNFSNISSMEGIQSFINLITLNCRNNPISALDVSALGALQLIEFGATDITEIDFTNNPSLSVINARDGMLTSITLNNPNLTNVDLTGNQLTEIDVSQSPLLGSIIVQLNQLTSLDLTQNPALTQIYANNNALTSMNIRNGNNTGLTAMVSEFNPALTCIAVDDPVYANSQVCDPLEGGWCIDSQTSYQLNCSGNIVNIPDANFKDALINDLVVDTDFDGVPDADADTNNDGEIQISEAEEVRRLFVIEKGIGSLEGIEAFIFLEELFCGNNLLSSLNIVDNVSLESLNCADNTITQILIGSNSSLEQINFSNNQIEQINLNGCPNLQSISGINNNLSSIDLSANTNLEVIALILNELTELDISNSTILGFVDVSANQLTSLDVSTNSNLSTLIATDNSLEQITFLDNPNLLSIIVSDNQLTNLDLSSLSNLRRISAARNNLVQLDLSNNPALEIVGVTENNLQRLDLRNGNNTNLSIMYAQVNPTLGCILVDDIDFANNQICDTNNNTGWCKDPIAQYTDDCALSVPELKVSNLSIYPNPAQTHLYIQSEIPILDFHIYGVDGSLIRSGTSTKVDISTLNSGMYFIEVQPNNAEAIVRKFIKD